MLKKGVHVVSYSILAIIFAIIKICNNYILFVFQFNLVLTTFLNVRHRSMSAGRGGKSRPSPTVWKIIIKKMHNFLPFSPNGGPFSTYGGLFATFSLVGALFCLYGGRCLFLGLLPSQGSCAFS